jgi:hypothetical protein
MTRVSADAEETEVFLFSCIPVFLKFMTWETICVHLWPYVFSTDVGDGKDADRLLLCSTYFRTR